MGDKLQTIVQTAVTFDIAIRTVAVKHGQQFAGIGRAFASIVGFQFHSHIQRSFSVKLRCRFIAVAVDHILVLAVTLLAIRVFFILVLVHVIYRGIRYHSAATNTADIVIFVAAAAQHSFLVPTIVGFPDTFPASAANQSFCLGTAAANRLVSYITDFIPVDLGCAMRTSFHDKFLPFFFVFQKTVGCGYQHRYREGNDRFDSRFAQGRNMHICFIQHFPFHLVSGK